MPFDKLVDSAKLDGALKSTADAIRSKTGGTGKIPWSDTEGFKSAVEGITVGGGGSSPAIFENVMNMSAVVSVQSYHSEIVETDVSYETYAGVWFPHSDGVSATTDQVVTYAFPVVLGSTYTITMTEIGNRLRRCFTAVDPSTITGNEGNIVSDFMDDTSNLVAGYEFTYTATKKGWYLIYVSNQNERPNIDITGRVTNWIED